MAVRRSTDIWCDDCPNWAHFGSWKSILAHRRAAKRDGWTRVKRGDGYADVCPACNGTHPDYWSPWFDSARAKVQR